MFCLSTIETLKITRTKIVLLLNVYQYQHEN